MEILDVATAVYSNNVFNKVQSVGTRAALENCLPYNLDTANKLPTTSVLTKQAGGKEIKFNARG